MFDELAENFLNLEILAEVQGPLLRGLAATIGLAAILYQAVWQGGSRSLFCTLPAGRGCNAGSPHGSISFVPSHRWCCCSTCILDYP